MAVSLSPRLTKILSHIYKRSNKIDFTNDGGRGRHVAVIFDSKGNVYSMWINGQSNYSTHAEAKSIQYIQRIKRPKGKKQ